MKRHPLPKLAEAPSGDDDPRGPVLLALARATLVEALTGAPAPSLDHPWLHEPGACFVTLRSGGELRGCLGSLEAKCSLYDDLRHNAVAAALRDPRFPPLAAGELANLQIEVSLLSPLERLQVKSEAEAHRLLRPGIDGVLLAYRFHRGTFLPQVWEQLPDPADFLAQLKKKAGLAPGFWHRDVELWRYTVSKWG